MVECRSLREIDATVNLLVFIERKDLRLLGATFSNNDGNLSLNGVVNRGHSNTKWAISLIEL